MPAAAPEPAAAAAAAGNKLSTELTATPGKDKAHVAAKGVYELDDHMLSREAIIERYKVCMALISYHMVPSAYWNTPAYRSLQ